MVRIYDLISRGVAALALITLTLATACGDGQNDPTIESISLSPSAASIVLGTDQQFTAEMILSDGSTGEIPSEAVWASSNTSVASVSQTGLATSVGTGTTTISLTGGEVSVSAILTVTDAELLSLSITPTMPSIAAGTTQSFVATGTFSDSSTEDVTSSVTWSSSDTDVATISGEGLATSTSPGTTTITANAGSVSATTILTVTAATLLSIQVTPSAPSIAAGTGQQFTATGSFSDSTTQNLTTSATWSSSATATATISNDSGSEGLATSAAAGSTTITATLDTVSGSTNLTVTDAALVSIAVTPATPSIAAGTDQQFAATGTFTDDSTQDLTTAVVWSSADTDVASVSNTAGSEGLASGLVVGSTTISATSGGISGATDLTVSNATLQSIAVTPLDPTTALGVNQRFAATGTFSDATTQNLTNTVAWSSGDTDIADVSNAAGTQGLATPIAVGTSTITAQSGAISGSSVLTVSAAELVSIAVTPVDPSIALGFDRQFTAMGTFTDGSTQDLTTTATWSSSLETVATISNAADSEGLATTLSTGSTTITATRGDVSSSSDLTVTAATIVSIAVTDANQSVALGSEVQYTATATFSDTTNQNVTDSVTWASSEEAVATISNAAGSEGLASSESVGSTTISATTSGVTGATELTITDAALVSLTVSPGNTSIAAGTTRAFTVEGTFTDGSVQDLTTAVTWSSSDDATAVISNADGEEGVARGLVAGSATITATDPVGGLITDTAILTVTAAELLSIAVTPSNPSIALGNTQPFVATASFTDGSSQDVSAAVTWSSSDAAVATVSNAEGSEGLATSASVGSTTITATSEGISGSSVLTVTGAVLASIAITPAVAAIANGTELQLTATGTFTDSTTSNLTTSVTWSDGDSGAFVTVSNADGSRGLASSVAPGASSVSAALSGVSATINFTVTDAVLESISVAPANPSIALGTERQFTALGNFSDATTQDLTDQVAWLSDDQSVATISSGAGTEGLASSASVGSANILATFNGVSGSAVLTVTAATLVSIAVQPQTRTVPLGNEPQYSAVGTFTDDTTQVLTGTVNWTSSDVGVATISNTAGSRGLASSLAVGTTTIRATDTGSGVFAEAALTVSSAELVSIAVTPANRSVPLGTVVQYAANGTFTDNTIVDITGSVTWSCPDDAGVASISNAAGSRGEASTEGVGSCTVTATDPTTLIAGTTSLSVTAATLVSIEVSPATQEIALGTERQFTATGTFTDDSTQNLTEAATWASSDPDVAVVGNTAADNKGLATGEGIGNTVITATVGSVTGSTLLDVSDAALLSIAVTATNQTDPLGSVRQFTATGSFTDGTTQNLTTTVTWSSSVVAVASISNAAGSRGEATSASVGSTVITAIHPGTGIAGNTNYTVSDAALLSIAVTPDGASNALGFTRQFTATGTFTDGSTSNITNTVNWGDGDAGAFVTVSNGAGSRGLATTEAVGVTSVIASDTASGISDTVTYTVSEATLVSIAVTPAAPSIALGTTRRFTATGTFSDDSTEDLSTEVTWLSSATGVATISNADGDEGLADSVAVGSTTIVASIPGSGLSGSTLLTVTAAALASIEVSPGDASQALGFSESFSATGIFTDTTTQDLTDDVVWSSSDTLVATISNAAGEEGLATTIATGSTTITATLGDISGTAGFVVSAATLQSIEVSPGASSVALGSTQQFTATGTFSDNSLRNITGDVAWSCPAAGVATISSAEGTEGRATTQAEGSCTATATLSGVTGTTLFTVTSATLLSIAVEATEQTIALGTGTQFTATGTFTDDSTENLTGSVNWTDGDGGAIASISNADGSEGAATSVSPGTTIITASQSGVSGSLALTVTEATLVSIAVTPDEPSRALGTSVQFAATGTFTDSTTQNLTAAVTWSCPTAGVATISNAEGSAGFTTTQAVGSCEATAQLSGVTGSTTMTVTDAVFTAISIDPVDPSIALGTTQVFTAIGTLSDSTTQDITTQVTWSTDDGAVAIVSNADGSQGVGISVSQGTVTVTAAGFGLTDTTSFTITDAALTTLTITPLDATLAIGSVMTFTVEGEFTDSTTQDLSTQVTWFSSNTGVATISNSASSEGVSAGIADGVVTITATDSDSGVTTSTSLTVGAATGRVTFLVRDTGAIVRMTAAAGAVMENLSARIDILDPGPTTGPRDGSPAVSRNGQWTTLVTERFGCEDFQCVAILNNDFSESEVPLVPGVGELHPEGRTAISNDGNTLVYSARDVVSLLRHDLFATQRSGDSWTAPVLLTGDSLKQFNKNPVLSPDGARVLFNCGLDGDAQAGNDVCEVGIDGTGFQVIVDSENNPLGTDDPTFSARHADYAPDGSYVFEADWAAEQIWRLASVGATPTQIIPTQSNDNSPCVLPNGDIASLVLPVDPHELTITAADGSSSVVITEGIDIADVGMSCHN